MLDKLDEILISEVVMGVQVDWTPLVRLWMAQNRPQPITFNGQELTLGGNVLYARGPITDHEQLSCLNSNKYCKTPCDFTDKPTDVSFTSNPCEITISVTPIPSVLNTSCNVQITIT